MKKEELTAHLSDFGNAILNTIEEFKNDIPPYEVGYALICMATDLMLTFAPNHLIAIKTVLASVENGIAEYQRRHEEGV